jgi:hypothetical protein
MQRVTLSPEIRGVLLINGHPAVGSRVFFGHQQGKTENCAVLPSAKTDAVGRFRFPAATALFTTGAIASRRHTTTVNHLCFEYQGRVEASELWLVELSDVESYDITCHLPIAPNAIAEDRLPCHRRAAHDQR